jgi:tripartite-type tricarboxylate transporter receptor subunit TctC
MARRSPRMAALALCAAGFLGSAHAQDAWPSKPIQMIIPASAGSGTDVMARVMAQRLAGALKQPVIVENRPGASGSIGINAVIKAQADGYTILYTNASFAVIAPAIVKTVTHDPTRDLAVIAQTAVGGVLLLVNKDVPAKTLPELIELVKSNPDRYGTYGTWATGSSGHLMMEWLKKQTGMKLQHVPYRAVPQLLTELSSGELKIGWADPSAPVPFVRSGAIRGIAISGNTRVPQTPDIATMGEQGYRFDNVGWFGMFAPAGTRPEVVQRLSDEVNKVQASAEMAAMMSRLNFEPPPVKTQAQFREIVANDFHTWKKLAADANIVLDQ